MDLTHLTGFRFLRTFTQSPRGLLWSPLEIEYDEATGKIGTLPEPMQKFVDSLVNQAHKGLRTQIADLETKINKGGGDAVDREKLKALEEENNRHRTADAERKAEYEKALQIAKDAEAKREDERKKELDKSQAEITRRDGRLREMARSEIKMAAKTLGARNESLDELAQILGAAIDLDPDLQPFVKGTDGKPAVVDGKPVTIEGHVKTYLDSHPHHRASTGGTGGGARGGASMQGVDPADQVKLDDLEAQLADAQKAYRKNHTNTVALSDVGRISKEISELKAKAGGARK